MWKKFLSVMAIVGLLAAQTALAADPVPGDGPSPYTPLLSSVTVTPSTFNPTAGETTTLRISVSQPVYVGVKVLKGEDSSVVMTVAPSMLIQPATGKNISYTGKVNGSVLADGKYFFYLSATDVSGNTIEYKRIAFNINSTPVVENLTVKSLTVGSNGVFDLTKDSKIGFNFEVNKTSTVALVIKNTAGEVISTLSSLTNVNTGTFEWDGRDSSNRFVEAGTYTAALTATAGTETASKSVNFTVKYDGVVDSTIIKNVILDPNPWDPSEEDLEIEWELAKDVRKFSLTAIRDDGKKIELWEDEDMDADDYKFEWNGLDDDDDYIREGVWVLEIKADNDVLRPSVMVKYSVPSIYDDIFVTKTSFDNTIGESTYVVFRTEDASLVTVDVLKSNNKKIETLMDEKEVSKNKWYAVKWDGTDDDGDEVVEGTYKFRVTAANKANTNIKSSRIVEVTVEEDTVSSGKSNVTNDYIYPVIFSKNATSSVELGFKIDEEAEVTVEIFKGTKTSNPEITLMKNQTLTAKDYKMIWDGKDKDGKKLDNNTKYSYLITTKVGGSSSKTDKERGFFVIGEEGGSTTVTPPTPPETEDCGFWDVKSTSPYCEAIAWAKSAGIFGGYPDKSFRQYSYINRAESLKVVLEAFNVAILPDDYTNLGFTDVDKGAWYMKYIRTGKFYGMVHGYGSTTLVKPAQEINRVELLKYVLEAAETLNGYKVPVCNTKYYPDAANTGWYKDYVCLAHDYDLYNTYSGYFYPGNAVMRGEVALLLYRLNEAGLLKK